MLGVKIPRFTGLLINMFAKQNKPGENKSAKLKWQTYASLSLAWFGKDVAEQQAIPCLAVWQQYMDAKFV